MTHLPECPMLKPCADEYPEHGLCFNFAGPCMHCMAECICDALRVCEARVTAAAVQRLEALPGYALRDTCLDAIKNR